MSKVPSKYITAALDEDLLMKYVKSWPQDNGEKKNSLAARSTVEK